jgi:RimJ/RimL family protein N-acetyltransferase
LTLDRHFIARQFERQDIYEMFGFNSAANVLMGHRLREDLIVATIKLAQHQVRIGFALMFPPSDAVPFWEFGYAVTEPRHRNAFNAVNSMDAMAHYTLDILGLERVGGRTREDNRAAAAIALRCGHQPQFSRVHDTHVYTFYTLESQGWARRKEKLKRGEQEHPWAGGSIFHILKGPPYIPIAQQERTT